MNKIITVLFLFIIFNNNFNIAFHGGKELTKVEEIQQASFRFLISSAYRNSQKSREWCEESKVVGGRPYLWSDHRTMAINYIDLYIALQFDTACETQLKDLRKIYFDQVAQPTPFNDNKEFWEGTLLPKMLDAFSCGFTSSKIEDFDFVSDDLLTDFNTDQTKQKIWHMINDYMLSIYKQRENPNRRLDFDAGLYVPFLDTLSNTSYTFDQNMRVGFPTYIGRSLWHIFHTIAQRISDSECTDTSFYEHITELFKNFMVAFARGQHPCPFCREHFASHVLINDRNTEDPLSSEAVRFYPIEHLLMGGVVGDAKAKFSTITSTDKRSLAAFFWKLHNTVTSSVEASCSCYMEESYDTDPYKCIFNSESIEQKRYPRQYRSYPFMKRFEFILTPDHNFTLYKETRESFKSTNNEINALDTLELRKELFWYWKNGTKVSEDTNKTIQKLTDLIEKMTKEFLDSPILSVYSYTTNPLNCETSTQYLNDLLNSTSKIEAPLFEIPIIPELCEKHVVPSACDKQYKTNTTTIIKEEEKSSSHHSSHSSSVKLNYSYLSVLSILFLIVFNIF
ncbi:hypothetical protein DICPUDRAFT_147008 [Dictyostelium purpureum]|uniref:Sulfhydryl oxidase n=1 Tax=Dictyostelium purpureum TaxID=5786 RepID=F0Z7F3_DICPU|nr:uncharacterized protein DICPUDRAFT_147008 [Dictyostelium purpureum]EGC40166.1 hypothetical protein DICPUDRAFT_147008 [Dictyostelium purpureum]|eukprot:XP_003283356.1 hypothetical protein DICPUDRAFT_147008 [Dictyostelium purpureum]